MNPNAKLIKEVKRTAGGNIGQEGLERSLALIEAGTPVGALMATLGARDFTDVMIDVARHRPEPEILAWMTIAAAGPAHARRARAKAATRLVAPHELIETLLAGGNLHAACEKRAEEATSEEEWGAWLLLARLPRPEIRRLVKGQAPLLRRYRAAKRESKRPVNPRLADQLAALGLV